MAKKVTKKVSKKAKAPEKKEVSSKSKSSSQASKKVVRKEKTASELNKEAEAQNAQAEQDVAPEDLPLGNAIQYANKAQLHSAIEDEIPGPKYEVDPNEVKLAERKEKEEKKSK